MWKVEFSIGLSNGWWFLALFLVLNIFLMIKFPSHYRVRILQLPDFSNGMIIGILYAICLNGSIVYSVFVSIKLNEIWFPIGLVIYIVSALCFINALANYAHTDPSRPVTTGIYRISRNPQQIFAAIMWIGVGVATTSLIIIVLCILQLILAYPTFKAQEEFCLSKYGDEYQDYMTQVPRYIGCSSNKRK